MSRFFQGILVLSVAVAMTGAGWAQQSHDPGAGQSTPQPGQSAPQGQGRQRGMWAPMEVLARKLNLTEEQRQKFREIGQHSRQQAMSISRDSSLTDDQKREKLLALRKQSHQEMFGVLTPEQKEQLKQMREQMQKEHSKSPGNQASAKSKGDEDDPFAGMTSDDDDGPIAKAP
jgi:Spy/CpxP family protein refolding chaperone